MQVFVSIPHQIKQNEWQDIAFKLIFGTIGSKQLQIIKACIYALCFSKHFEEYLYILYTLTTT